MGKMIHIRLKIAVAVVLASLLAVSAYAQDNPVTFPEDSTAAPAVITLEQALQIALEENVSVKVADMEIVKTGYARKGTYSALYPQINGTASYQRTIKKQVMYMDGGGMDISSMIKDAMMKYLTPLYAQHPDVPIPNDGSSSASGTDGEGGGSTGGISVGRWNTWSAGLSLSMPLVNAQLWETLKLSDKDVELSIEKARSSRLDMVTQVKQAYFAVLLAKQLFEVYKSVYENAVENLEQTQKKYNAKRASELDLTRAKTTLANAIPNVYDAENTIVVSQWQLKAVMGVDLKANIDVAGTISDYSQHMFYDLHVNDDYDLSRNTTMRQLAIQAEELASTIKIRQNANIPTLSLGFNYSINAMTNDFVFSEFNWSPYSYVGLSLNIPIFSGFNRSNAIKQAKVQAAELEYQRADSERQLRIAIRQYLGTMDTAVNTYSAAETAVESARKAFDIAQQSYNVGRSTLTDLNDAQLALTQAELSVTQAAYKFIIAKTELEKILGADFIDDDGNVKLNKTYGNE